MQHARCKFVVESVTHHGGDYRTVKMDARYDEALSEEDRAFSNATPTGKLEFGLNNPALNDFFTPGRSFYIDLTPAE